MSIGMPVDIRPVSMDTGSVAIDMTSVSIDTTSVSTDTGMDIGIVSMGTGGGMDGNHVYRHGGTFFGHGNGHGNHVCRHGKSVGIMC